MTIPETCPHCGSKYAKDGKFSCDSELISGKVFQSQFCKLNQAAKEALSMIAETQQRRPSKSTYTYKEAVRKLKEATL